MFCPVCKDEFRPGFTECAGCGVALVERSDVGPAAGRGGRVSEAAAARLHPPMVDYCGFLTLDEARDARSRLGRHRVRCEIVIRESTGSPGHVAVDEEYWLRVERDRYKEVIDHLGFDAADSTPPDETFTCGECGSEVASEESFCPDCGARFED
ncbi:MAG TPA: hypothetical protein VD788_00150, partial [Candidatus Polarisedimenticolaceae bacterium]|nr:hypothetical protein [Candidatus Polarisedimenticolaceae bacterium]